jgi:hypothetical protein
VRHFRLSEEERARLHIRKAIGRRLGADTDDVVKEPLPERLVELLRRLEDLERTSGRGHRRTG